ncbi:hypothetical protein [Lipingzhangella rawalii]|uniref:hypothetical protein n=1 Tax=Lipingzhangella rawalii TaxID=2055835 RepID=UPI00287BB490|nr:hypothetical protein [Lipingzhangella rawalii]
MCGLAVAAWDRMYATRDEGTDAGVVEQVRSRLCARVAVPDTAESTKRGPGPEGGWGQGRVDLVWSLTVP